MKPNMEVREMLKLVLFILLVWAGLTGVTSAQTVEYIHTDALGSPVAMTDTSGNVTDRTVYEPYGAFVNRAATDSPGFTGHLSDAATGFSYMQQRYYDSAIGRFVSADPVMADSHAGINFNRYWYADNSPYRFTDPDGRQSLDSFVDFWSGTARGIGDGIASTAQFAAPGGPSVYGTVDTSSFRSVQTGPIFGSPTSQVGQGGYKFGSALFVSAGLRGFARGTGGLASRAIGGKVEVGAVTTLKPGPFAGESIPARSSAQTFSSSERSAINRIGADTGCHTCGTTTAGTKSGNFVPDHQPVSSLNSSNAPQKLYPQCINCSRQQGLDAARELRKDR